MAIKPEDVRTTQDGYVDLRYPGTSHWVRTTAPMRVAGGQDVKLVEEQARYLEEISTKFVHLRAVLENLNSDRDAIGEIPSALREFGEVLARVEKSSQTSNSNFSELKAAIAQLDKRLGESFATLSQAIAQLSTLPETLSQLQNSLDVFGGIRDALQSLEPITTFDEDIVRLTANEEKAFAIPNNTKSVTFRGRKYLDSNNRWRSHDIRWSFAQGSTLGQIYQTLFAYSEESLPGGLLKEKTLYFWCANNFDIEIVCGR
jgi:hypothetical protein